MKALTFVILLALAPVSFAEPTVAECAAEDLTDPIRCGYLWSDHKPQNIPDYVSF